MKVLVGGEKEQSVIPPPITHNAPTPRHNHRRSLAIFFIGFCLFLTCKSWSSTHETLRNPAYLIEAQHGAVASENERCSNIGVAILKEGGNAVDAAISTTLCVGVVNMFSYASKLLLLCMLIVSKGLE